MISGTAPVLKLAVLLHAWQGERNMCYPCYGRLGLVETLVIQVGDRSVCKFWYDAPHVMPLRQNKLIKHFYNNKTQYTLDTGQSHSHDDE